MKRVSLIVTPSFPIVITCPLIVLLVVIKGAIAPQVDFNPQFKHHDYEALEAFLAEMNKNYPDITRLYSVGKSVEKRQLYVLEISDNPGRHEPGTIFAHLFY